MAKKTKLHGGKEVKSAKLQVTKAKPPRDQGVIVRNDPLNLSLATGTYGTHMQKLQLKSFRLVGCGPEICYTAGVSHDVDYNTVWNEFERNKKRPYNIVDIRKELFGNRKGGYIVRDPHVAVVVSTGTKNGMAKQPQDFIKELKKREVINEFKSWSEFIFPTKVDPEVESIISMTSNSGGTSVGMHLSFKAIMALLSVSIKHELGITYLEPEKQTDWAVNNQRLFLTLAHITNLSSTTALILTEDSYRYTDFSKDPENVDPTKLDRDEIDKMACKVSNALLASRKINSTVEEEFSDTLSNFARNLRTKCLGLCGGRWNIPMLDRSWIYKAGNQLGLCKAKHIDRLEMFKLLTKIFTELYDDPWKYALTSMDIQTEKKYYTTCPNYVVIAGGGLHANDTDLVLDAWRTSGLNTLTRWTPIPMLHSNADYLWVCLVHLIQGRVIALERIFETPTQSRVVKSFQSLLPPKAYAPYKDNAIKYAKAIASRFGVSHWSHLFSMLKQNQSLSAVLDKEVHPTIMDPISTYDHIVAQTGQPYEKNTDEDTMERFWGV